MYPIKTLEAAAKEFNDAIEWYEKKSTGLGGRFSEAVRKKIDLISNFPERYPKRKGTP